MRRAASRRARCARGRRALVGDSSPSEERGAGAIGMPGPSNRQVKQEKRAVDSRKYAVSSVLGARPRPRPRTGPATCRANWLVGGGAASPSHRRKQCRQLCARGSWCKQMHARCGEPGSPVGAGREERPHASTQGRAPRGCREITPPIRAPCSPLGARCTRHTVSPETLPCPSIVKCDLVCKCHLRTAVHL